MKKDSDDEIVEETKAGEVNTPSQGQGEENETKAIDGHTPMQGQGEGNAAVKEKEKDEKDADEIVEEIKASEELGQGEGNISSKKDADEIVEDTKASEMNTLSQDQGEGNISSKKDSDEIVEEIKPSEMNTVSQGQEENNVSSKKDPDEMVEETKASEELTLSQAQGEGDISSKKDADEIEDETKASEEHTPTQGTGAAINEKVNDLKEKVRKNGSHIVNVLAAMGGKKVPPPNKENENEDSQPQENGTRPNDQDDDDDDDDDDEITPESDLRDFNRRIWVVTTASLPWRTGTAVNPLARALYLTRGRPKHYVGLVIPWLESQEDQAKIYGSDSTFETQQDQEAWIRKYAKERVHCESK
jgi:hypothetical protein